MPSDDCGYQVRRYPAMIRLGEQLPVSEGFAGQCPDLAVEA